MDITATLRRAVQTADAWRPGDVRDVVMNLVGRQASRSVDWDEDAGEAWARVLDDEGVVALIGAKLPLVILRSPESGVSSRDFGEPEVIQVEALTTSDLSADLDAVLRAFPELEESLTEDPALLDVESFSVDELWFATV